MVERANNNQEGYQVNFISHATTQNGYIEYMGRITAPGGHTFHIKDRYSSMRSFQSTIKKQFNLATFNGMPTFPPKKSFGSKNTEFLN